MNMIIGELIFISVRLFVGLSEYKSGIMPIICSGESIKKYMPAALAIVIPKLINAMKKPRVFTIPT